MSPNVAASRTTWMGGSPGMAAARRRAWVVGWTLSCEPLQKLTGTRDVGGIDRPRPRHAAELAGDRRWLREDLSGLEATADLSFARRSRGEWCKT